MTGCCAPLTPGVSGTFTASGTGVASRPGRRGRDHDRRASAGRPGSVSGRMRRPARPGSAPGRAGVWTSRPRGVRSSGASRCPGGLFTARDHGRAMRIFQINFLLQYEGVSQRTGSGDWRKKFRAPARAWSRIMIIFLAGRTITRPARRPPPGSPTLPDVRTSTQGSREFPGRAARYLGAGRGIRQFPGIGTGYQLSANVHEVAQRAAPGSPVVYAGNNPVVLANVEAHPGSAPPNPGRRTSAPWRPRSRERDPGPNRGAGGGRVGSPVMRRAAAPGGAAPARHLGGSPAGQR
jgi:hypothetical protein